MKVAQKTRFRGSLAFSLILILPLLYPAAAQTTNGLGLRVKIEKQTVVFSVTNHSGTLKTFYNGFARHRDGEVPSFTYVIAKRADTSVITTDHFKDGRYSPLAYSSFEFDRKKVERRALQPGETYTYSAPLSRFFDKAPWPYRFGFSWVKVGCRVEPESGSDFVEADSGWVEVDYREILRDAY